MHEEEEEDFGASYEAYRAGKRPNGGASSGARANGSAAPPSWIVNSRSWDPAKIPLRPWIAPKYAMRRAVTLIVGAPSGSKSSMMLAWASSLALGIDYGDFCPRAAGKAFVVNVEDDDDEQQRRLTAVLNQFDAVPADLDDKVFRFAAAGLGTLFEFDPGTGILTETRQMMDLRALLLERRPDMLIVDPMSELHTVPENDNTGVRRVVATLRTLARELNMAVIVLHHTRKGTTVPGDMDIGRGASSANGVIRVGLTLCGMSEEDAELLGIEKNRETRSAYLRLDDGKQSYAPISDARWFQKKVYQIPNGEYVPAVVPWSPKGFWSAVTTSIANEILNVIDAGLKDGRRYSNAPNAGDRAACRVVTTHVPALSQKAARMVIAEWLKNGVLREEEYDDPKQRKPRMGLVVDPSKRPGAR